MPECLIAFGSNLGDRADNLQRALDELARAPRTQVIARSAWHETPPVGGPSAQGPYLNGAVLASTTLDPPALWQQLARIEIHLGRVRGRRWEARTVDLDVLLYDRASYASEDLAIPHPRMHYRRFVLTPAREVAPWMVHPDSGWTVARLAEQLDRGADEIAVATADPHLGAALVAGLARLFRLTELGPPHVLPWNGAVSDARRPKLVLAACSSTGSDGPEARKMLQLPATGPIAWLTAGNARDMLEEAAAVVASAWPALAGGHSGG